jgi:hypothetical protein
MAAFKEPAGSVKFFSTRFTLLMMADTSGQGRMFRYQGGNSTGENRSRTCNTNMLRYRDVRNAIGILLTDQWISDRQSNGNGSMGQTLRLRDG